MNRFSLAFAITLLSVLFTNVSAFFFGRSKSPTVSISSKDCCMPPKMNVNSQKANLGRDFLRQLTVNSDFQEEANPQTMCNLMHFLFQQAALNNKPVIVTQEMFVLFDSTNQVLNRILKSKKFQQYETISNGYNYRQYLSPLNPLRYVGRRDINAPPWKQIGSSTAAYARANQTFTDRYPTYGIDIPGSCLPSNFDHIIFGELPPFIDSFNGKRMFIKPDRFGIERTMISSAMNDIKSFVKEKVKQRFCRYIRGETKSECAKIRAFKSNTDKILLKKWTKILSNLPSKWNINKQYKKRAVKYGIYEIDQQSRDLEGAGAGKDVKNFRKLLIQKYGQDNLRIRQGREIIFTITELKQSHATCQTRKDPNRC